MNETTRALPETIIELERGLRVSADATIEDMQAAANRKSDDRDCIQWEMGDLYNAAKERDLIDEVFDNGRYVPGALSNLGSVCGRYPQTARRRELSYDHHAAVVWVRDDLRDALLNDAMPAPGKKAASIARDDFRAYRDDRVKQCKKKVDGKACRGTMVKVELDGVTRWACLKCENERALTITRKTITLKDATLNIDDGLLYLDPESGVIPEKLLEFDSKKVKVVITLEAA